MLDVLACVLRCILPEDVIVCMVEKAEWGSGSLRCAERFESTQVVVIVIA